MWGIVRMRWAMATAQEELGRASVLIQRVKQTLFDAGERVALEALYLAGSGAATGTEYWADVGGYLLEFSRSPLADRLNLKGTIEEILGCIERGTNLRYSRSVGTAEVFGAGGSITVYPANIWEEAVH